MKAIVGRWGFAADAAGSREESTLTYWYREAMRLRGRVRELEAEIGRLRKLAETPFDD